MAFFDFLFGDTSVKKSTWFSPIMSYSEGVKEFEHVFEGRIEPVKKAGSFVIKGIGSVLSFFSTPIIFIAIIGILGLIYWKMIQSIFVKG